MPIHFGTDGWRAVISDTFTFHNLRLVSQAIADAVKTDHWNNGEWLGEIDERKIIVGFDTRFLSDRYARDVARVLAANGFTVYLSQADCPTPAISYAVQHHQAVAGIVITASHNAPRYNGIKLKAAYGGSALPEQSRRVEIYLNDNEERGRGPNLMDWDVAREMNLIERFNPLPAYYDHLRTLINFDAIAENPPRVVVDSMHGSGRGVIKGILQGTGCEVTEIRGEMNPGFGGTHPEPIGHNLGALAGAISTGIGDLGLALDGDADRIGAMDERGNFVDPHKIMALAFQPCALRAFSLQTSSMAAPSLIPEALPGVTVPSFLKAGLSEASFSSFVSGRGCSSFASLSTGTSSSLKASRFSASPYFC